MISFKELVDMLFTEMCPMEAHRIMKKISKLHRYDEVFKSCWDMEEIQNSYIFPEIATKSLEIAKSYKDHGDHFYEQEKYKEAIHLYSHSIRYAPHTRKKSEHFPTTSELGSLSSVDQNQNRHDEDQDRDMLANGFANRSAAYFDSKAYNYCINNIDQALRLNVCDDKAKVLKERRKQCAKNLGAVDYVSFILPNDRAPPVIRYRNTEMPAFSNALKVAYTPEKGIHVVAARNLVPGELIAVEHSYSTRNLFNAETRYPMCSTCLMYCQSPIPCPSCVKTIFCSEDCKRRGLKSHRRECYILLLIDAIGSTTNSQAVLAVKTLLRASFPKLDELKSELRLDVAPLPKDEKSFHVDMFSPGDFRSVHYLAGTRRKMTDETLLLRDALVTVIMVKVLLQSETFFIDELGDAFIPSREDIIFIGGLLMYHQCVYPTPFYLCDTWDLDNKYCANVVAEGTFPSLSLMRHSCNPPTLHFNSQHHIIVKTSMSISAGQEITLAYSDRSYTTSLVHRQMKLENFGIKCKCEACIEKWPYFTCDNFTSVDIVFKCPECHEPVSGDKAAPNCTKCKMKFSRKEARGIKKERIKCYWQIVSEVTTFGNTIKQMGEKFSKDKSNVKYDDFMKITEIMHILCLNVQQPHPLFRKTSNMLRSFYYMGDEFTHEAPE